MLILFRNKLHNNLLSYLTIGILDGEEQILALGLELLRYKIAVFAGGAAKDCISALVYSLVSDSPIPSDAYLQSRGMQICVFIQLFLNENFINRIIFSI